jgi:Sec-independent protein translocase protein TatA
MLGRRRPVARTIGAMAVGGAVVHSAHGKKETKKEINQLQQQQQELMQQQHTQQSHPQNVQNQQYSYVPQPQQQYQQPEQFHQPIEQFVSKQAPGSRTTKTLGVTVFNIPDKVTKDVLDIFFGGISKVCDLKQDGTAYLEFDNEYAYNEALSKHGHHLYGRAVQVFSV